MKRQRVMTVKLDEACKIEIELGILGKGDVEQRVLSAAVLLETRNTRDTAKQVACCLNIGTNGIDSIIIGQAKANLHDEKVLVIVTKNSISVRYAVEVVVLKLLADPRHINVVQIERIETEIQMTGSVRPTVAPRRRENSTVELRTVLQIPCHSKFPTLRCFVCKRARKEWRHEAREGQLGLNTIFLIILIVIAFKARDGFEGPTKLKTELLTSSERLRLT